jgi:hypothetical protein
VDLFWEIRAENLDSLCPETSLGDERTVWIGEGRRKRLKRGKNVSGDAWLTTTLVTATVRDSVAILLLLEERIRSVMGLLMLAMRTMGVIGSRA